MSRPERCYNIADLRAAGRRRLPKGAWAGVPPMLFRVALALRSLMFVPALAACVGALLMFWEAGAKLVAAAGLLAAGHGTVAANVTASIMSATDGLLFGVVLLVFAYALCSCSRTSIGFSSARRRPSHPLPARRSRPCCHGVNR